MRHSPCFHLCSESTDEEVDKLHCLNHSGSSATYSDYSPSQGSSGSSNPPANPHVHTHSHPHKHTPTLPAPSKDQAPQTHWTNRYTRSLPVLFQPSLPSAPSTIIHLMFPLPFPLSFLFLHALFPHHQGQRDSLMLLSSGLFLFFIASFYVQSGFRHFRPFSHGVLQMK